MVLEVAYQFFLLRIYGNHRLTVRLKFPDLAADMLKLRIPIRVRRSFQGLAIGLQAVVHRMQKFCHHAMAGVVPRALEFGGQLPHALASPPQRRLRVTASHRFHQRLQIALEGGVLVNGSLSPGSLSPDSLAARRFGCSLEFGDSADYRPP
jgi:hypothetical protein